MIFEKVLIANRGEIAVRIVRTLDRLGIASVAVYSDADAGGMHVRAATEAVRIGPADARASYLNIDAIVRVARETGAQAIHPGYGFLAENPRFARACADAGLVFVGPPANAIETMGDKIRARVAVEARGVATVPGIAEPDLDDAALIAGAARVGYPVLVKPAQGGGGKGMHRVDDAAALPDTLVQARREASSAFGDDALFVERFVAQPRHIEVQVLADSEGATIHLGERECSLQRRHQKVIEEAPSSLLTDAQRDAIGRAACETARAVGYVGAGTVEFIVSGDRPDEPFFMEMNTRLQVEHPVTELVTGVDIVEQQLRIAAGKPLAIAQDEVRHTGHAIEARVYAEDPAMGFAPSGGSVAGVEWPTGEGIRVDAGVAAGDVVSSHYDPMLAKIVALAPTRAEAIDRLDDALRGTHVLGVRTNVAFLCALLGEPAVRDGDLDTGLIDREAERLAAVRVPDVAFAQAGLALIEGAGAGSGAWIADGWRIAGAVGASVRLRDGDAIAVVTRVAIPPDADDHTGVRRVDLRLARGRDLTETRLLERPHLLRVVDDEVWVADSSGTWLIERARNARRVRADAAPVLASPMPGTVVALHVADGDAVAAGDAIVSVEAMKMEHVLRAPVAGIAHVDVAAGDTVARGQEVAVVAPFDAEGER